MIVLLPPSEGKSAPSAGDPLDLAMLANSDLNPARELVIDSLVRMCVRTPHKARKVLGLSTNQREEVEANTELRTAPAAPARQIYTGVLFGALDLAGMSNAELKRAANRLLITSSLFGVVTPEDLIPAYRLPGDATLPKVHRIDGFWRKRIGPTMTKAIGDELLVDMRSGTYVKFWPVPAELAERALSVKIWQVGPDGNRTAVSHHNKATKGELARLLASAPSVPGTAAEAVTFLRDYGWNAMLSSDPKLPHERLDITTD